MPRNVRRSRAGESKRQQGGVLPVNPLADIHLFSASDLADALHAADMILKCEDQTQQDPWQPFARPIMTTGILHICYRAACENRVATLDDLRAVLEKTPQQFSQMLVDEVVDAEHDPGFEHSWRMPNGELTNTHPFVRAQAQAFLDLHELTLFGGLSATWYCLRRFEEIRCIEELRRRSDELGKRLHAQRS